MWFLIFDRKWEKKYSKPCQILSNFAAWILTVYARTKFEPNPTSAPRDISEHENYWSDFAAVLHDGVSKLVQWVEQEWEAYLTLPVRQRILYKVVVTAFDCVRGTGPAYFRDICLPVADISGWAHVRSAERCDLLVPQTRTRFGQRSFHVAAPIVWNSLPTHLRSTSVSHEQFRDGLKTHLFTQAYAFLWELLV